MIIHALTISLIVLFLHACTWKGMIFEGIKKIVEPESKLHKPVYGCPICMSPWHGTYLYWMLYHVNVVDWVTTVFTAAGFSVLWVLAIDIKDYLKKMSECA